MRKLFISTTLLDACLNEKSDSQKGHVKLEFENS